MTGYWVVGYQVIDGGGAKLGAFNGIIVVGTSDALYDDSVDGNSVCTTAGECDGYPVGYSDDGVREGTVDGWWVGDSEGVSDNNHDGAVDGGKVGDSLGDTVGWND